MMRLFLWIFLTVMAWLTFGMVHELALAKGGKGCCERKDCGSSLYDTVFWWTNLLAATGLTLYVLMLLYYEYETGAISKGKASLGLR